MNQESFQKYVESTRDCDAALLDIAVNKGLREARGYRLDYKKLLRLAAMCAVTAALCAVISSEPVRLAANEYIRDNSPITQSGAETLHKYLSDITGAIMEYLGGN